MTAPTKYEQTALKTAMIELLLEHGFRPADIARSMKVSQALINNSLALRRKGVHNRYLPEKFRFKP